MINLLTDPESPQAAIDHLPSPSRPASPDDEFDRLDEEVTPDFSARSDNPDTNRVNISVETVAETAALYPPDQAELIIWSHKYAIDHQWSLAVAAREFKLSTTTISRIWRGKYREAAQMRPPGTPRDQRVNLVPNPRAGQLIAIDTFIKRVALYRDIVLMRPEGKLPVIETSTYRKIKAFIDKTLVAAALNWIIGASQIGKSTAFKDIARGKTHIFHVQVPAAASYTGFIAAIADALGICEGHTHRTLVRIKARLNPETLLILDRAHFIFETYTDLQIARVLAGIQEIYDDTGCAMLISATKVWEQGALKRRFVETFKQLSLRTTSILQLGSEPAWEDVVAVCTHHRLPTPGDQPVEIRQGKSESAKLVSYIPRDVMKKVAKDGLGKVTKLLAAASASAARKETPLTWESFLAHYDLSLRAAKATE
jgi:hypothetical protein